MLMTMEEFLKWLHTMFFSLFECCCDVHFLSHKKLFPYFNASHLVMPHCEFVHSSPLLSTRFSMTMNKMKSFLFNG